MGCWRLGRRAEILESAESFLASAFAGRDIPATILAADTVLDEDRAMSAAELAAESEREASIVGVRWAVQLAAGFVLM